MLRDSITTNKLGVVAYAHYSNHVGGINRITMAQTNLGKNLRPYLKNSQSKKIFGVAQVEECLPSKHEALSSNPVLE
jgi:hypothetical protein